MKKLFIFALIGTLIFQPIQIKAETTEDITDKLSGETLDAVFEDMKANLENGEEVSFGASLNKVGGLYVSPDLKYDLSGTSIDMNNLDTSLTNLGFSQLTSSLAGSFNNLDLSGNAAGCTELFNAQFGDLSLSLNEDEYGIPADFNIKDMLISSYSSINSAYSDAINTESFQTVKNSISIGSVFSAAQQGAKKYALTSEGALKAQLGIPAGEDLELRYGDKQTEHQTTIAGYQTKLNIFYEEAWFTTYESMIGEKKDQVKNNIASQLLDGNTSSAEDSKKFTNHNGYEINTFDMPANVNIKLLQESDALVGWISNTFIPQEK